MIYRWFFTCFLVVFSGMLRSQNAPVTTVPELYGVIPGEVNIPVMVSEFNQIGAISLSLVYDPAVLTFVQGELNNTLNGMFAIGNNQLPSGLNSLAIGWFGDAVSLPDGTALINLKFNFAGGTTSLNWSDDGASCEYTDPNFNALNDIPTDCHYQNGLVTSDKCLNLSFLLEGLYDAALHQMHPALDADTGPCSERIADKAALELRNAADYTEIIHISGEIDLRVSGHMKVLIPSQFNGPYFITIYHRNSIATVSAVPVSFTGNVIDYCFSDLAGKAYGGNMKPTDDGRWAFFAGDVNQDGFVDTGDMSPVDNDAAGFASGYLATDVNGDGMVDTADVTLIDNNAAIFTGRITP